MCGIVGTLNLTKDCPVDELLLRKMLGAIRHRGPDQFGTYVYRQGRRGVGLGNARLSIIDLGGGQQPISNEDGTVWIVFNGEIYNYRELRSTLEGLGHQMATDSDTEVIVHLYEQFGPKCVTRLNGQFAFAIWDERAHTLFIARDRLGIRPLHYTIQDGSLIFASEIKALLADPRITAELDPATLDDIFTFWSPRSPRTAFKGIKTLPPGHTLLVTKDGQIGIEPYWQIEFPEDKVPGPLNLTLDDATCELRRLLIDATQLRLRADVPVGAYLSGGLDSSAITAIINRYTGNRLETFSIAFADSEFDESSFQLEMAQHLGTRHHLIRCTHEDIGLAFPNVIWHTELPILRTSPVPLYLLSKLVHGHGFKVVLTGEGADEILAGYNIFKEDKIRRFWARQPESEWRSSLLGQLYPYIGALTRSGGAYLQRIFGQGLTDLHAWDYSHAIRWRNTSRGKRFFSTDLKASLAEMHAANLNVSFESMLPRKFTRWSSLARAQYLEMTLFLAEYLLSAQGDRVAMAHSVEGRFPFLDHRVAEFCNQLPPRFKLKGLDEKYLLKRAMRDLLPNTILSRPKRPYRAPIHCSFFPDGRPLDWVAEMLSPRQLKKAGCFEPGAVTGLVKKIERYGTLGETDDMALAGILSTQLTHHKFVEDFQPPLPLNDPDDVKTIVKDGRPAAERGAISVASPRI